MNDKLKQEYLAYVDYAHELHELENRALQDLEEGENFMDWPELVHQMKMVSLKLKLVSFFLH
jgi:hypothetical protein